MRLFAILAILATCAAQGAGVTKAKFGDIGLDDKVVTDVDLSGLGETDPTVPAWAKDQQPPLPPNYANVSNKAMTALQSYTETDPTVPSWAKSQTQPLPPNYNNVSNKAMTALQSFTETDPNFNNFINSGGTVHGPIRLYQPVIGDEDASVVISTNGVSGWRSMQSGSVWTQFSFNWWDLITNETDPTVPQWAKANSKPSYSWSEITSKPSHLDGDVPTTRKVNGTPLSSDITLSASDVGAPTLGMFNTSSNLAATADGKATIAIAYLQGDDAKVVVTNYDSAVTMPSQSLQQRIDEGGTNYWKVVWNELTRWNRFTGDGFDWAAWCGFSCFRTNVLAQLDQKADRAWGYYDSHAGNYAPDGYTWISSPKIAVAAGLAYQRTITSEGAVWVLVSNGLVTETAGNLGNGYFRVSDDEGNSVFEIVKGDKRTVGAQAGSLSMTSVMGITHLHITYAVVSDTHPTLEVCTSLEDPDWKDETSGDCAANVSWTGSSGAWVAEVWGKAAQTAMFVKATYEIGGETYIKNSAPVKADGGILCTDGIHKVRPVWNNGTVAWEVVQ